MLIVLVINLLGKKDWEKKGKKTLKTQTAKRVL